MTIDVHTHYLSRDLADGLRKRMDAPRIEQLDDGLERYHMPHGSLMLSGVYYDMDARIAYMDGLGVTRQILSFPGLFGVDSLPLEDCADLLAGFNEHVAGLAEMHPTRFSGLAALPFAYMDEAVREYRRARLDLGLIGAILPVNLLVTEDHAASLAPVFAAAQELGGHLFVHPGRRPDEVPSAGTEPKAPPFADNVAARLALAVQHRCAAAMITLVFSDFLDAYPDVTLHVASLGGTLPMVVERMDQVTLTRTPEDPAPSSSLKRVHVDCSSLGPRAIEIAAAFYGADKILFGTDCPIFMTDWSLDAVANTRLSDTDKHAIREGNAARLLDTLL